MTAPTITILSALQRTDGSFLVDIGFEVADVDLDDLTINLAEFSLDGVLFSTATPQTFDRQHDAVSPLTGITAVPKSFNFVWNAFQDLAENAFDNIDFKIEVTDGVTPVSDTFNDIIVNTLVPITEGQVQQDRLNRRKLVDRLPSDFFGFGLIAPFERVSSDFRTASGITLIKARIKQIINTRGISPSGTLGELPWLPDFGVNIEELRHLPNDDVLPELAFISIGRGIARHEPLVELLGVKAIQDDTTMRLELMFGVKGSNDPNNLVFADTNKFILEVGL